MRLLQQNSYSANAKFVEGIKVSSFADYTQRLAMKITVATQIAEHLMF